MPPSVRALPPVSAILLLLLAAPAEAHPLGITQVRASFAADGEWTVEVEAHAVTPGTQQVFPDLLGAGRGVVLSLGWDEPETPPPAEEEGAIDEVEPTPAPHRTLPFYGLRGLLEQARPVRFDGVPAPLVIEEAPPAEDGTTVARLSGRLPEGARQFRWSEPEGLGVALLTITAEGQEAPTLLYVPGGERSDAYVFGEGADPQPPLEIFVAYLREGFVHIVPGGADHLLFLLALFLLSARLGPLIGQATAFTVAHSVTLGLVVFGVASVPAGIVEPLIALSIAALAAENLLVDELKPRRYAVVFGFGLLHGAGFAGALTEVGVPESHRLGAVAGFNLGVELAQVAVLALLWSVFAGALASPSEGTKRRVRGASLVLVAVGLLWAVERVIAARA